jgi:hypothetical protein
LSLRSFIGHSYIHLPFPAASSAISGSFICHRASLRVVPHFCLSFRSEAKESAVVVAAAVAVAFAFAAVFLLPTKNQRHLDRSNRQSHRLLRSGETPHFAFAFRSCICLSLCLSFRSAAEESAVALPLTNQRPLPLFFGRHPERSEGSLYLLLHCLRARLQPCRSNRLESRL